jgi:hypothetical protein
LCQHWILRRPTLVMPTCKTYIAYTAEKLLLFSLQEGARPAAAAAAFSPMQLCRFGISLVRNPALLRALPAAVLTRLDLQHSSSWRSRLDFNSSSITAALAQLSGLRSLQLDGSVHNPCITAVGQLAQLTHLGIDHVKCPAAAGCCDVHLLPQQCRVWI